MYDTGMVTQERQVPIFPDNPRSGAYRVIFETDMHSPTLAEEVKRYRSYVNTSPLRGEVATDVWVWSPNAQSHPSLLREIRRDCPSASEESKFTILSFNPSEPTDAEAPHIRIFATTRRGLEKTLSILQANVPNIDDFDVEIKTHPFLNISYRGGLKNFNR